MNSTTVPTQKKSGDSSKERFYIKDCIIGVLIVAFLGLILYSRFSGLPPDQWTGELLGVVGDFTIYLLGIVGVFEFCYDNGILLLVPNKYIKVKEESLEKQIKTFLYDFLDQESEFLAQHEEERLANTLAMMGLSNQSYRCVKSKVLEARLAPVYNIDTARKKILDLLFYSDVVCDLRSDDSYVNMDGLLYYIRFHDLMHDQRQCNSIASAMATFISLTCEQEQINLSEIDVIMVPHNSNYLLGLSVSKILNKCFIKMIPPEKRIGRYSYEGVIPDRISKKTVDVLILHDVLLTGRQIYESANSLKETLPNCNIHGLFSVIYRNVKDGKGVLERRHDIKCYNMIELTEEKIENELKKRGKC